MEELEIPPSQVDGFAEIQFEVFTGVDEGTSLLEEVSTEKQTVVVSSEIDSFMGSDGSSGEIQPEGKELSNVKGSDVFLDSASVQPLDGIVAGSVPTEVQQEVEIHSDDITSEATIVPLRLRMQRRWKLTWRSLVHHHYYRR